ncbi:uncharacterized protein EI90DRAFT_3190001 [Cantharellus anzutake]|uniref:uncharacterized protein n=1 Tax=Cantharellus anzutake TaxID=1750568 RepID=UPI0019088DC5|nr:uncharacterized protein EI90DRAFT_3190001 [Cantharellus anzutake]KAF8342625.1 hypothetical protein EI90DRAFT_3190001 [Cantharellus anzutake]
MSPPDTTSTTTLSIPQPLSLDRHVDPLNTPWVISPHFVKVGHQTISYKTMTKQWTGIDIEFVSKEGFVAHFDLDLGIGLGLDVDLGSDADDERESEEGDDGRSWVIYEDGDDDDEDELDDVKDLIEFFQARTLLAVGLTDGNTLPRTRNVIGQSQIPPSFPGAPWGAGARDAMTIVSFLRNVTSWVVMNHSRSCWWMSPIIMPGSCRNSHLQLLWYCQLVVIT